MKKRNLIIYFILLIFISVVLVNRITTKENHSLERINIENLENYLMTGVEITPISYNDEVIAIGKSKIFEFNIPTAVTEVTINNPSTEIVDTKYTLNNEKNIIKVTITGKQEGTIDNIVIMTKNTDNDTFSTAYINNLTIKDNSPAKIVSVSYSDTKGKIDSDNNKYITAGSTVVINMEFSKKLTTAPSVTIVKRDSYVQCSQSINTSGNIWKATCIMPDEFNEGELLVEIHGYMSENGASGEQVETIEDSSGLKLIYDKKSPTISTENIIYEPELGNGDKIIWNKSQTITITAHDDVTSDEEIEYKYMFVKEGEEEQAELKTAVNGQAITIDKGTGKYIMYYQFTDNAGNTVAGQTKPLYLDNSITLRGKIKATKGSENGNQYTFTEKRDEEGRQYYEGGYVGDDIYLHMIEGEDNESGGAETTYAVYKIVNGEEIVVGEWTKEDTILEEDNEYKVVIKTTDSLANMGTRTYLIHKGVGNITFTPNGNDSWVGKIMTKVRLIDTENKYTNAYYAWEEDGKEPLDTEYKAVSVNDLLKGKAITSPAENGKYRLYIKTVAENGDTNIVKSNTFMLRGKITNPGTMLFKENDANGKEIEISQNNEIRTNQNIYIKIKEQGKDDFGGDLSTVYTVTKEGETAVGNGTTASTVLKVNDEEEQKYILTLKSESQLGATKEVTYTICIDKKTPEVTFEGNTTDYENTGALKVKISDTSELKEETLMYYWTLNKNKVPTKEDFEGPTEDGYRGKIETAEGQTISLPKTDVSGDWILWVYAEDKVGNIAIKQSTTFTSGDNVLPLDKEPPIAGRLKMTEINTQTKEEKTYTPGTKNEQGEIEEEGNYTNQNVKIELLDGYDAHSGVASNKYSIIRENDQKSFGNNITKEITLTEHGIYTATVTTIDNNQNKATRTYEIKIDKNDPQITYTPDGNSEYAKQHTLGVNVTEEETESGVNTAKIKYIWLGYNPSKYSSKEAMENKIKEFIKEKIQTEEITNSEFIKQLMTEENIEELEKLGIYVSSTQVTQTVKTPEGKTGIYCLAVYAEDNLENSKISISEGYYIDNTNPTKPEIKGTVKQMVGTQEKDAEYYGEKTNKEVTVIAQNSKSLSGVDRYEYTLTTDEGKTWTEWKAATVKETVDGNTITKGKVTITNQGKTVVKFRSIAELLDVTKEGTEANTTTLVSEEAEEFTIVIDKKGPEVTFENTENGENGSKESIEKIKVRATVTDEAGIAEHTLKYAWVSFENVEEFNAYKTTNHSLEDLKTKMDITNAKTFSNGEEIPSPENIGGIYSLFVYAEDSLGNTSVNYSEYYAFNLEKEEQNLYKLEGKYITRVIPETKVEDFIEKVKKVVAGSVYEAYDKDGNQIEEGQNVTTESTVKIDGKTYTIIVVGDLNGDGKLTITDISKMRLSRVGKTELVGAYEKAADINDDGKISLIDLSRMTLIRVGLADFIE